MDNIFFVGDIHARPELVTQALRISDGGQVIFLGDIFDGPGSAQGAKECLDLIRAAGAEMVLGNHELYPIFFGESQEKLAEAWALHYDLTEQDQVRIWQEWCELKALLTEDDMEWLRSRPLWVKGGHGDKRWIAVHAQLPKGRLPARFVSETPTPAQIALVDGTDAQDFWAENYQGGHGTAFVGHTRRSKLNGKCQWANVELLDWDAKKGGTAAIAKISNEGVNVEPIISSSNKKGAVMNFVNIMKRIFLAMILFFISSMAVGCYAEEPVPVGMGTVVAAHNGTCSAWHWQGKVYTAAHCGYQSTDWRDNSFAVEHQKEAVWGIPEDLVDIGLECSPDLSWWGATTRRTVAVEEVKFYAVTRGQNVWELGEEVPAWTAGAQICFRQDFWWGRNRFQDGDSGGPLLAGDEPIGNVSWSSSLPWSMACFGRMEAKQPTWGNLSTNSSQEGKDFRMKSIVTTDSLAVTVLLDLVIVALCLMAAFVLARIRASFRATNVGTDADNNLGNQGKGPMTRVSLAESARKVGNVILIALLGVCLLATPGAAPLVDAPAPAIAAAVADGAKRAQAQDKVDLILGLLQGLRLAQRNNWTVIRFKRWLRSTGLHRCFKTVKVSKAPATVSANSPVLAMIAGLGLAVGAISVTILALAAIIFFAIRKNRADMAMEEDGVDGSGEPQPLLLLLTELLDQPRPEVGEIAPAPAPATEPTAPEVVEAEPQPLLLRLVELLPVPTVVEAPAEAPVVEAEAPAEAEVDEEAELAAEQVWNDICQQLEIAPVNKSVLNCMNVLVELHQRGVDLYRVRNFARVYTYTRKNKDGRTVATTNKIMRKDVIVRFASILRQDKEMATWFAEASHDPSWNKFWESIQLLMKNKNQKWDARDWRNLRTRYESVVTLVNELCIVFLGKKGVQHSFKVVELSCLKTNRTFRYRIVLPSEAQAACKRINLEYTGNETIGFCVARGTYQDQMKSGTYTPWVVDDLVDGNWHEHGFVLTTSAGIADWGFGRENRMDTSVELVAAKALLGQTVGLDQARPERQFIEIFHQNWYKMKKPNFNEWRKLVEEETAKHKVSQRNWHNWDFQEEVEHDEEQAQQEVVEPEQEVVTSAVAKNGVLYETKKTREETNVTFWNAASVTDVTVTKTATADAKGFRMKATSKTTKVRKYFVTHLSPVANRVDSVVAAKKLPWEVESAEEIGFKYRNFISNQMGLLGAAWVRKHNRFFHCSETLLREFVETVWPYGKWHTAYLEDQSNATVYHIRTRQPLTVDQLNKQQARLGKAQGEYFLKKTEIQIRQEFGDHGTWKSDPMVNGRSLMLHGSDYEEAIKLYAQGYSWMRTANGYQLVSASKAKANPTRMATPDELRNILDGFAWQGPNMLRLTSFRMQHFSGEDYTDLEIFEEGFNERHEKYAQYILPGYKTGINITAALVHSKLYKDKSDGTVPIEEHFAAYEALILHVEARDEAREAERAEREAKNNEFWCHPAAVIAAIGLLAGLPTWAVLLPLAITAVNAFMKMRDPNPLPVVPCTEWCLYSGIPKATNAQTQKEGNMSNTPEVVMTYRQHAQAMGTVSVYSSMEGCEGLDDCPIYKIGTKVEGLVPVFPVTDDLAVYAPTDLMEKILQVQYNSATPEKASKYARSMAAARYKETVSLDKSQTVDFGKLGKDFAKIFDGIHYMDDGVAVSEWAVDSAVRRIVAAALYVKGTIAMVKWLPPGIKLAFSENKADLDVSTGVADGNAVLFQPGTDTMKTKLGLLLGVQIFAAMLSMRLNDPRLIRLLKEYSDINLAEWETLRESVFKGAEDEVHEEVQGHMVEDRIAELMVRLGIHPGTVPTKVKSLINRLMEDIDGNKLRMVAKHGFTTYVRPMEFVLMGKLWDRQVKAGVVNENLSRYKLVKKAAEFQTRHDKRCDLLLKKYGIAFIYMPQKLADKMDIPKIDIFARGFDPRKHVANLGEFFRAPTSGMINIQVCYVPMPDEMFADSNCRYPATLAHMNATLVAADGGDVDDNTLNATGPLAALMRESINARNAVIAANSEAAKAHVAECHAWLKTLPSRIDTLARIPNIAQMLEGYFEIEGYEHPRTGKLIPTAIREKAAPKQFDFRAMDPLNRWQRIHFQEGNPFHAVVGGMANAQMFGAFLLGGNVMLPRVVKTDPKVIGTALVQGEISLAVDAANSGKDWDKAWETWHDIDAVLTVLGLAWVLKAANEPVKDNKIMSTIPAARRRMGPSLMALASFPYNIVYDGNRTSKIPGYEGLRIKVIDGDKRLTLLSRVDIFNDLTELYREYYKHVIMKIQSFIDDGVASKAGPELLVVAVESFLAERPAGLRKLIDAKFSALDAERAEGLTVSSFAAEMYRRFFVAKTYVQPDGRQMTVKMAMETRFDQINDLANTLPGYELDRLRNTYAIEPQKEALKARHEYLWPLFQEVYGADAKSKYDLYLLGECCAILSTSSEALISLTSNGKPLPDNIDEINPEHQLDIKGGIRRAAFRISTAAYEGYADVAERFLAWQVKENSSKKILQTGKATTAAFLVRKTKDKFDPTSLIGKTIEEVLSLPNIQLAYGGKSGVENQDPRAAALAVHAFQRETERKIKLMEEGKIRGASHWAIIQMMGYAGVANAIFHGNAVSVSDVVSLTTTKKNGEPYTRDIVWLTFTEPAPITPPTKEEETPESLLENLENLDVDAILARLREQTDNEYSGDDTEDTDIPESAEAAPVEVVLLPVQAEAPSKEEVLKILSITEAPLEKEGYSQAPGRQLRPRVFGQAVKETLALGWNFRFAKDSQGWVIVDTRFGIALASGETQKEALETAKSSLRAMRNRERYNEIQLSNALFEHAMTVGSPLNYLISLKDQPSAPAPVQAEAKTPFVIAGTGSRNLRLDDNKFNLVKAKLTELLSAAKEKHGDNLLVLSGMAEGFDEALAEAAMAANVKLQAAIPNRSFGQYYWRDNSQTKANRYAKFVELCQYAKSTGGIVYVCGCSQEATGCNHIKTSDGQYMTMYRNLWMVDRATRVWVYNPVTSGTKHCYEYAKKVGVPTFEIKV